MISLIDNFLLIGVSKDSASQFLDSELYEILKTNSRGNVTAKWTVMVYMAADNNLEYFGVQDLNELEMVGSNEDINILVQLDRHPDSNVNNGYTDSNGDWTDTRRFYVQHDEDKIKFHNYTENKDMWLLGELNMALPQNFENFLHWSFGNYSAEHYLLVFWDHGEGIFSNGRGGIGSTTNYNKSHTRGICNDETNNKWLESWELRNVFTNIKKQYNVQIDIISFDICWVGTIETAYDLMDFADYFTGSPEEEPNPGWNYRRPISYLAENPDVDPSQLAKRITTDFQEEYKDNPNNYLDWKYYTYTAVDLHRFKNYFIPLLNTFSDAMINSIFDNYDIINNARSNTMYPHNKGYMRDIFGFAKLIENDQSATPELRAAAAALNAEYSQTILEYVHGPSQPKGMGPTIYFPTRDYRGEYNSKIRFSSELWDDFIRLFLTPIQIDHKPLNDTETKEDSFVELQAIIKGFSVDVDNIFVFYIDNKSDSMIPVQMEKSESGIENEYSAKLKILNYESTIYYYIRTQESGMTQAYVYSPQELIIDDTSSWYSFKVGVDTDPPVIIHDMTRDINGVLGEPYTFFVNITDNLGIDPYQVFLYYKSNNTNDFIKKHLESSVYPNQFKYTIPPQEKGTMIYYYFSAMDKAKINNSAILPNEGTFEFNVSRVKPIASFNVNKAIANTYEAIEFVSTSKPEKLITTYLWYFGDGTEPVNGKNVIHKFSESNVYTVTLKVIDENGLWSTTSYDITIKNSPPIALIQTDPIYVNLDEREVDENYYINGTVYENDIITLDCSGSIDLDGYIQTWSWQFSDGNKFTELWTDWNGDGRFDLDDDKVINQTEMSPTELRERLSSSQTGIITYNYKNAGDYKIRFSVIDNEGLVSDVQYLNIYVENKKPEPKPKVTNIDGLTVAFIPNDSKTTEIDTPSDMATLNYTWDFGDGQSSNYPKPNHTYSKMGKYTVTLTVRDNDGAESTVELELDLMEDEVMLDDMIAYYAGVVLIVIIFILVIIIGISLRRTKPAQLSSEDTTKTSKKSKIYQPADLRIETNFKAKTTTTTKNVNAPRHLRTAIITKSSSSSSSSRDIQKPKQKYKSDGELKIKDLMVKLQNNK